MTFITRFKRYVVFTSVLIVDVNVLHHHFMYRYNSCGFYERCFLNLVSPRNASVVMCVVGMSGQGSAPELRKHTRTVLIRASGSRTRWLLDSSMGFSRQWNPLLMSWGGCRAARASCKLKGRSGGETDRELRNRQELVAISGKVCGGLTTSNRLYALEHAFDG